MFLNLHENRKNKGIVVIKKEKKRRENEQNNKPRLREAVSLDSRDNDEDSVDIFRVRSVGVKEPWASCGVDEDGSSEIWGRRGSFFFNSICPPAILRDPAEET
jgi:hypothetical protein